MAKKLNQKEIYSVTELIKDGLNNVNIAKKLNCNEKTIRNIRKNQGLSASKNVGGRPRILTQKEENRLNREYEQGKLENSTHGVNFVKELFEKKISGASIKKS